MKRSGTDRAAEDASLATALLAGEPDAPGQAWKQLSPLVRRMLSQRFGGSPDEQDLCQEVFLRFFMRISELRKSTALRSFLVGICLGVAQNEIRRSRVRRRAIGVVARIEDTRTQAGTWLDVDGRQAIGRLCEILGSVSPDDSALFAVRHIEKMEVAQIAAARGWSMMTTKRRLKRVTRRVGSRVRREPALSEYARRFTER
ncbi:MAG: RNA polymerase sigma factor [Polyangia bacterium]